MTHRGLVCLLFGALAWGQATPAPAPAAAQTESQKPAGPAGVTGTASPVQSGSEAIHPDAPALPPDAPVITINGLCDNPSADKTPDPNCKTIVTRAQFEDLVNAIAPNMVPFARKQFAGRYANALIMGHQAQKMGLDQGPKFDQLMKLQRLTVLNQLMGQNLQDKAGQASDADLADYYNKNTTAYEEITAQRIFVPKSKTVETPKGVKLTAAQSKTQQEAGEKAMKTEADSLRKRAAAGEDFAKLQAEAFTAAGVKTKPPSTSMDKMRHSNLPPTQSAVFDLKKGETSQVIVDPSGYFIFKAGDKDVLPLDKVKDEIKGTLRSQRMQESMQAVQQSATPVFDDKYFVAQPGQGAPFPIGGNATVSRPPAPPQPH